jgi:HEAT repeat protein
MRWNNLRAIDPESLVAGDPDWELFGADLLLLEQDRTGLALDVGWNPEASPDGQYTVLLIRGTDWSAPLERFRTRSLESLLKRVEEVLANPPVVEPVPTISTALDDLAQVLDHDPDERVSKRAAALLERHGTAAVPVLIGALNDPRAPVRYAVVDTLRRIGDPVAGAALFARLTLPDPDFNTRRLLLRALGAVRYGPAIPTLITFLQSPDAQQRAAAASALSALRATEARAAVRKAYVTEPDGPARDELRIALNRLAHS